MMDESATRGTRPGLLRALLLVVAVAVAVGVGIYAFAGGDSIEAPGVIDDHRPEPGEPAPDFGLFDVRDTSEVRHLSDHRGTPVIVNWYASWCGPCRREIPDFQQAYEALDGRLVILGVNLEEDQERAESMLDDNGASYPAVLDMDREVADHYRVSQMPTTFFVAADGTLVESWVGYLSEEELRARLEDHFGLTY